MTSDCFRKEFDRQSEDNFPDWRSLILTLDEDTLMNGCIRDEDVARVCCLLEDKATENEEFLYSLLSTFWSLPDLLTPDQARTIAKSIIKICKLKVGVKPALILLDALRKISPGDFSQFLSSNDDNKILALAMKTARPL